MRNSRQRVALFWLLLLTCLALSAADVAWTCQSPDQAQLPSQTNMLADEVLDPNGFASAGDAAPPGVAEALQSPCALRPSVGYDRPDTTKLWAATANLARAPPSA